MDFQVIQTNGCFTSIFQLSQSLNGIHIFLFYERKPQFIKKNLSLFH